MGQRYAQKATDHISPKVKDHHGQFKESCPPTFEGHRNDDDTYFSTRRLFHALRTCLAIPLIYLDRSLSFMQRVGPLADSG